MKTINIIRSETWLGDNLNNAEAILNNAINDFVTQSERIVNIECETGTNGLSRFWIYTETIKTTNK